jgi:integrase
VVYIEGVSVATGKPERIYYIRYRKNGKLVEEKVGRQFQDDMTPARANQVRIKRIEGDQLPNRERREPEKASRLAETSKWTIDKLWEEYKSHKSDSKALRTDDNRYQNYVKPAFGEKEPQELIPLDVIRLRTNLLKKRSPQTVKHVLGLLQRIINFGAKKHLCKGAEFHVEMPKVNNIKTEDLTPERLSRLLEAIEKDANTQAAHIMKMALFTGMRRGEMFKLKWDDIDYQRGFIKLVDPKGGSDQKIPLNDPARDLLLSHSRGGGEHVFPGRGGRQRTDIKHQVNRIKEAAGLPKDFRALHGR